MMFCVIADVISNLSKLTGHYFKQSILTNDLNANLSLNYTSGQTIV